MFSPELSFTIDPVPFRFKFWRENITRQRSLPVPGNPYITPPPTYPPPPLPVIYQTPPPLPPFIPRRIRKSTDPNSMTMSASSLKDHMRILISSSEKTPRKTNTFPEDPNILALSASSLKSHDQMRILFTSSSEVTPQRPTNTLLEEIKGPIFNETTIHNDTIPTQENEVVVAAVNDIELSQPAPPAMEAMSPRSASTTSPSVAYCFFCSQLGLKMRLTITTDGSQCARFCRKCSLEDPPVGSKICCNPNCRKVHTPEESEKFRRCKVCNGFLQIKKK